MLRRYLLILIIMALLTPLGLLAEGTAWGEWGGEDLMAMLGFVPKGIDQASSWWQALLPDYSVKGAGEKTGYVISAFVGSTLVYLAAMAYMKAIARAK